MATKRDLEQTKLPIGIYRANITPIERLIMTTVGRSEILDDLMEKLERNANKRGGQHYLFIGPRGIGKTHFLSLVENAVQSSDKLASFYTVIRFPEENNRILSFADLLLGIVNILTEKDADGGWNDLHDSLAQSEKDEDIIDTIVPRLKRYRKETGKTLLLMLENLDTLFTQQMKKEQDLHRLRHFLMDSPCAALIGTSPVYFPGLYSSKSPFYDFFGITPLENLSENETIDLIRKNLECEGRDDILENLDEFLPKIQALHTMTGGNPRLNVLLYELIAHDNLLDVKAQFQKLLDQISPFYQDRLKDLAPQERALLETMALMRDTPRTPAAIAARLRMKPQQTSSLLKRMTEAGYLTAAENPDDKRSRIYSIKEGFFDLWLAMSESRLHRRRLPYLAQFFERYYRERRERERKRKELWEKLENETGKQKENSQELLAYLSDLGDMDERCSSKIELAVQAINDGDKIEAGELVKEMEFLKPESAMFAWITDRAAAWVRGDEGSESNIQKWLDGMVEYWKTLRSGELERAAEIAAGLAEVLSDKGLHKVRIELLQDALRNEARPGKKISLLLDIAESYRMRGMLSKSLNSLNHALAMCREIDDKSSEGTVLNSLSQICHVRGDYDTALWYLEESLKIGRETENRSVEGISLNNIGGIHQAKGEYDIALKYFEEALIIRRDIHDRFGEGIVLCNISGIFYARREYDRALTYEEEALVIMREIGDRSGEGGALNGIGRISLAQGSLDKALNFFEESLKIAREIGNRHHEGITLNNIGNFYLLRGDNDTALQYLEESLKIIREIGDHRGEGIALSNIGQIYHKWGDYDKALKHLEECVNIRRDSGDRPGLARALFNLGCVELRKKNLDRGRSLISDAWDIAVEIQDSDALFNIGRRFGKSQLEEGNKERGLKTLRIAYEAGKSAGLPHTDELKELLENNSPKRAHNTKRMS